MVVSLGNVEVKTIVLAPWVVVIRIVDAGSVVPAAVETRVCVCVAKVVVCWAREIVEI